MIVREWRGRVRAAQSDAYYEFLQRTGLADYAATPGHLGTLVLVDRQDDVAEFTLLTLWESIDAIGQFAGDEISLARYYPGDRDFLLERPERVRHHEIVHDSLSAARA